MNDKNTKVENKLLAKEEFLQLDRLLNRFNVFEATDMGRREIKHTKFLSYLLDPNESHGLGEVFIRNVVTRIAEKFEKFPRILDIDFSFAEIKPELSLTKSSEAETKSKRMGQLDCLIKLPLRRQCGGSEIIIAIENKLDAGQGVDQLPKYSKALEAMFGSEDTLYKVFLTFHNEEPPEDKSWEHITYEEFVLPAVRSTIDILEEKGSVHLKATLNNYLELLKEDEDGDNEKDKLANEIIQDEEIKSYIDSSGKSKKRDHFGPIYVKHRKVIDYLCEFDSDIRTKILKWWKSLPRDTKFKVEDYEQELIFCIDTSIRSYLRFGVLTERNRKRLADLNRNSRSWLESKSPIVFEILLLDEKKQAQSEQGSVESSQNLFKCRATLTLGPLDSDDERLRLYQTIYPIINDKVDDSKNQECSKVWTRLISPKKGQWEKAKSSKTDNPQVWIERHVLRLEDGSIELEPWVKDLASRLNKGLDEYFKLEPPTLPESMN